MRYLGKELQLKIFIIFGGLVANTTAVNDETNSMFSTFGMEIDVIEIRK